MWSQRTEEVQQQKYAAWKKEIELEKEKIQIQKMHYLEMKSKNDDDFFKFTEMHAKERGKLDREWEKVHQLVDRATNVYAIAKKAEADAKKRKRDSSSVESGIVRKLVQRCPSCHLCRVCEPMHERYRRSKYGDDSF